MSDQSPLIVPLVVEALVVNEAVRTGGNAFLRAEMQYNSMQWCSSGEPAPFSTDPSFTSSGVMGNPQITCREYYDGVYLKWRLPDALTEGIQDNVNGATVYPLIPNRWLVVRYAGDVGARQSAAWIIESDYVWPSTPSPRNASQLGSLYVTPPSSVAAPPTAFRIGRNVPLAGGASWSEPLTTLSLTAMAPGNPAFAAYQPYCNNVLSFIDALADQDAQTLSYLVLGWYSAPSDDPLAAATADNFGDLLASLNWTLPDGTEPSLTANWSLFEGYVTGVQWQNTGPVKGGAPDPNTISVAIGNTSVEALTTLVDVQAQAQGEDVDAELLEAFQLDALDVLDAPDGEAVLADMVHTSGFQMFDGGSRWEIVDAPDATTSVGAAELAKEEAWLALLNQAQANYDDAARKLTALQLQLYVMWWKATSWVYAYQGGTIAVPGLTQQALEDQLNLAVAGSLAQQVNAQGEQVASLAANIPTGDTPDALQQAIADYGARQALPSSRVLKRASLQRFAEPNNPVLLFAGAGAPGIVGDEGTLVCRFPTQLVTGFTYDGQSINASTEGLSIPLPDLSGVSGAAWSGALVTSLIQEFFFLDSNDATMIAAGVLGTNDPATVQAVKAAMTSDPLGTPPAGAAGAEWQQNPWHPLMLCWQVTFYPLTYGTSSAPNWTFQDGQYVWNGDPASVGSQEVSLAGRIVLAPTAAFNLKSRIEAFLANNPSLDPEEAAAFQTLLDFVQTNDNWDLLSQALDGFNEQLIARMVGVFMSPQIADAPLPALIGDVDGYPPAIGDVPSSTDYRTLFQPWRTGQFVFSQLAVVDQWGQALWLIDQYNYQHYKLFRSPEMIPAQSVKPLTADCFVQLPPGLLQPARLDFDLVSATNDRDIMGRDADVNPICGWVLPNHLDASLMAYDPDGNALGELAVGLEVTGAAEVCWTPAPGSACATLSQLAGQFPHFGAFMDSLVAQGPDNFNAFLRAVDETLWTTAPTGAMFDQSLAVLMGRPLAMLRARLQYELNGTPYADPSWQFTFTPAEAAVTGYEFAIELGNVAQLDDGLIGYFVADDYDAFNVVQQAGAAAGSYLRPIGLDDNYLYMPFDGETVTYLSLLVDPRASVHATTAILPTMEAAAPLNFVNDALATMSVTFRVGPLLVEQQIPAGADGSPPGPPTMLMPLPCEQNGTWSWVENDEAGWQSYTTAQSDTQARLSNVAPVLRRGLLKLSNALD